jgi:hypothetical protein
MTYVANSRIKHGEQPDADTGKVGKLHIYDEGDELDEGLFSDDEIEELVESGAITEKKAKPAAASQSTQKPPTSPTLAAQNGPKGVPGPTGAPSK